MQAISSSFPCLAVYEAQLNTWLPFEINSIMRGIRAYLES